MTRARCRSSGSASWHEHEQTATEGRADAGLASLGLSDRCTERDLYLLVNSETRKARVLVNSVSR
jgi:hypothetical protein